MVFIIYPTIPPRAGRDMWLFLNGVELIWINCFPSRLLDCLVRFYGVSNIEGYLMLNSPYTWIFGITKDLVGLGFQTYQPL